MAEIELAAQRWRTGRKVGRTIYAQLGERPTNDDPLIGVMDSIGLAIAAVRAHNAEHGREHLPAAAPPARPADDLNDEE